MAEPPSAERLVAHLVETYGFRASGAVQLAEGVFRVNQVDGPAWVARVFPAVRAFRDAEGDAEILRRLEQAGFPAERCAHANPVSRLGDRAVLVTGFVDGAPPERGGRIFAVLGALLGGLHARPGDRVRAGGGWHHLTSQGGPKQEIDAARELLEARAAQLTAAERVWVDRLLDELDAVPDCAELPHAFVHPDMVPVNAIVTRDGATTIIDWAGSGRGPRLWSLAFLLYATGGHQKLIELVMARYSTRIQLAPEELDALSSVLRARPLLLDCWAVGHGQKTPACAGRALARAQRTAETTAAAVRTALAR